MRQMAIEKIDLDMVVFCDANRCPRKHSGNKKIARYLLCPSGRVVHHIACEELVKNGESKRPEKYQCHPSLCRRIRKIDCIVLGMELAIIPHHLGAGINVWAGAHSDLPISCWFT